MIKTYVTLIFLLCLVVAVFLSIDVLVISIVNLTNDRIDVELCVKSECRQTSLKSKEMKYNIYLPMAEKNQESLSANAHVIYKGRLFDYESIGYLVPSSIIMAPHERICFQANTDNLSINLCQSDAVK